MDLSLTLALWALDRLSSDQLPLVAADWLSEGRDAPALRELAGIQSPAMSEVGPLFSRALSELRLIPPAKEEALGLLGHHYAQQIVEGVVSPYEGARMIWWQVANSMDRPSEILLSFVGAASELDDLSERSSEDGLDRAKYRRELEEMVVESARALLKGGPHPSMGAPSIRPV